MARRRYDKRKQREQEDGLASIVADLASASTRFGIGATIVLLIAGLMLNAKPEAMYGLASFVGGVLLLCAAMVAFITGVGWLKRILAGKRYGAGPVRSDRMPADAKPITPPTVETREARPLLSKGELAFYDPLRDIVAGRYEILPKPSLVDVIGGRDHPEFAKIAKMHIDFVLCDRTTMRPVLAIELDDRSHESLRRAWSDARKTGWLSAAGIPLLRVRCQQAYDVADLREKIERAIG